MSHYHAVVWLDHREAKVVDFSVPYFSSDIGVLVKKGTDVDSSKIKGLRIGVQQATTGAMFVDEKLQPTTPAKVFPDTTPIQVQINTAAPGAKP